MILSELISLWSFNENLSIYKMDNKSHVFQLHSVIVLYIKVKPFLWQLHILLILLFDRKMCDVENDWFFNHTL